MVVVAAASVVAVASVALAPPGDLAAQVNWLLAGLLGDKAWPERFWMPETLFSVAARVRWVAPDRAPLPFRVRTG